jgi:Thioredoxin
LKTPRLWLVITEGWCGDGAQTLPVFQKISEAQPLIRLAIVLRDDRPEIMDLFLTGTSRSIPKVVSLHGDTMEWVWGPRPEGAQQIMSHADPATRKEQLHLWYARNKQQDLETEITALIEQSL